AAVAGSVALAQIYGALRADGAIPTLLAMYVVIQAGTHAIHAVLERGRAADRLDGALRAATVESVNVVLAWLLFTVISSGAWLAGASLSAVIVLAGRSLRKLDLPRQGPR